MIRFADNDSYRTDRAVLPLDVYEGRAAVIDPEIHPGDVIEVRKLRVDDKTGLLSVGQMGVILYSDTSQIVAGWEPGKPSIVQLVGGDEIEKIHGRLPNKHALEVWHEPRRWRDGFEKANLPYLHLPLEEEESIDLLLGKLRGVKLVRERYQDIISFKFKRVRSISPVALTLEQACDLTLELCQRFVGP